MGERVAGTETQDFNIMRNGMVLCPEGSVSPYPGLGTRESRWVRRVSPKSGCYP